MTTSVDVSRLLADDGPRVTLAGPQQVLSDGTGTTYSGFSSLSAVYIEAAVQFVSSLYGRGSLTLLIEYSDDGSTWSTAETFSFAQDGLQSATLEAPKNYLRASWQVGNRSEWYLRSVSAALAIPSGGGQPDVPFANAGTASTGTGAARYPVPRTARITGVSATAATAPTGASLIFDVNKNGTTIFTTQANRPTIAAGANQTASIAVPDVTSVATNDYLTVDIDQIGASVAGSDIVVLIIFGPVT